MTEPAPAPESRPSKTSWLTGARAGYIALGVSVVALGLAAAPWFTMNAHTHFHFIIAKRECWLACSRHCARCQRHTHRARARIHIFAKRMKRFEIAPFFRRSTNDFLNNHGARNAATDCFSPYPCCNDPVPMLVVVPCGKTHA